jgi:hypothetical protein
MTAFASFAGSANPAAVQVQRTRLSASLARTRRTVLGDQGRRVGVGTLQALSAFLQLADGHAIDARRPLVALDLLQRLDQMLRSTTASIDGPPAAGRSRQAFATRVSVSWAAALRASPVAPVPKFSMT